MKLYPKQGVACAATGGAGGVVDPKTFRKFIWPYIYALAELKSIVVRQKWLSSFLQQKNLLTHIFLVFRYILSAAKNDKLMTATWASSARTAVFQTMVKSLHPTSSMANQDFINGPFPCGEWPDINIVCHYQQTFLDNGKCVQADNGYCGSGQWYVKCPANIGNPTANLEIQNRVLSCHETVNRCFKSWAILEERSCHDLTTHGYVFVLWLCSPHSQLRTVSLFLK